MTQTENAVRRQQSGFNNRVESLFTNLQVSLYRLSGGSIGGTFKGVPVLLLTTAGRKTGKKRTKPLLYLMDNDQVVLVASHAGAPTHPSWWRNLQQNPHAEVQIKRTLLQVEAREATPEERERLWPKLVALYPDYENYQKRTTRSIPIVLLQRTK
ncbi:MAG: nitroreductase family deazaflavin-dependent oxidoreductase [Chloroflexi bacterium]|nr:nitroreductase family deazaflavin-dependent oxidoreductase [Chloroflexota bacterium]